jgi:hypothetical protein
MRCSIMDTQQNNNDKSPSSVIMQSVVSAKCMVSIMFYIVILSAIIQNVAKPNVVVLNVVSPLTGLNGHIRFLL